MTSVFDRLHNEKTGSSRHQRYRAPTLHGAEESIGRGSGRAATGRESGRQPPARDPDADRGVPPSRKLSSVSPSHMKLMEAKVRAIFELYATQGRRALIINNTALKQMAFDYQLIDSALTQRDLSLIYSQVKLRSQDYLGFSQFVDAMRKVAVKKEVPFAELIDAATPKPVGTSTQEVLTFIFSHYCKMGHDGANRWDHEFKAGITNSISHEETLDNPSFYRFCRDCPALIGPKFTRTDMDLVWTSTLRVGANGKRRADFNAFVHMLVQAAERIYDSEDKAAAFAKFVSNHAFKMECVVQKSREVEQQMLHMRRATVRASIAQGMLPPEALLELAQEELRIEEEGEEEDGEERSGGAAEKDEKEQGAGGGASWLSSFVSGGDEGTDRSTAAAPPRPARAAPPRPQRTAPCPPPAASEGAYEQTEQGGWAPVATASSSLGPGRPQRAPAPAPTPAPRGGSATATGASARSAGGGTARGRPTTMDQFADSYDSMPLRGTYAGSKNKKGGVFSRLSTTENFTGVYKRRMDGDGRINGHTDQSFFADKGKGYTGSTNQGTDLKINEIGEFMRPNLRDGAGSQTNTQYMRH